jgi:hypothetical protein
VDRGGRGGVDAFLPAGEVTRAQVLRLTPFCGGRSVWGGGLVAAELAPGDADAAVRAAGPGPGTDVRGGRGAALALSPFAAATADRVLGREHGWRRVAASFRAGLLAAVARG